MIILLLNSSEYAHIGKLALSISIKSIFLWPFSVAFPITESFRISVRCMIYCMLYYTQPSLLGNSPAHSWIIQCQSSQGCYEGNSHSIQAAINWSLHWGGGGCVLRAWACGNVWNDVLNDRLGHPTGEGCGGSGGKRRGCGHQRESTRSLPRKEPAELGPSLVLLEEGLHYLPIFIPIVVLMTY